MFVCLERDGDIYDISEDEKASETFMNDSIFIEMSDLFADKS